MTRTRLQDELVSSTREFHIDFSTLSCATSATSYVTLVSVVCLSIYLRVPVPIFTWYIRNQSTCMLVSTNTASLFCVLRNFKVKVPEICA